MQLDLLFVYGTLRRTIGSHHHLLASARFVGTANYQGLLYRVAEYPGVVASPNPAHQVSGELFELFDPDEVMTELDQYEGCHQDCGEVPEFIRVRAEVVTVQSQRFRAWIYLYQGSLEKATRIPGGDWRLSNND